MTTAEWLIASPSYFNLGNAPQSMLELKTAIDTPFPFLLVFLHPPSFLSIPLHPPLHHARVRQDHHLHRSRWYLH